VWEVGIVLDRSRCQLVTTFGDDSTSYVVNVTCAPISVQLVPLHEVESALYLNFACQILTALGTGAVFSPHVLSIDSFPITFTWIGSFLLVTGILIYLVTVVRKWQGWKHKSTPFTSTTTIPQSTLESRVS